MAPPGEEYIGVWAPESGDKSVNIHISRDKDAQAGWLSVEVVNTSTHPKTVYCQLSHIQGKLVIPENKASGKKLSLEFSPQNPGFASGSEGTGNWKRTSATVPPPTDLPRDKADMKLYYIAYGLSIFIFLTGLTAYITADSIFTVRMIDGTGLLACGVFTILNADLLVTFYRLRREVNRFGSLNDEFSSSLDKEHETIKSLQKLKTAFAKLDEQFQGNIEKAHEQVETLRATSQTQVKTVSSALVRMYCDADADHKLDKNEIEEAFKTVASIFGCVLKDINEKCEHLKRGVLNHKAFADGQIKTLSFSHIVEEMFEMPGKDHAIEAQAAVNRALEREAEREASLASK